MRQTRNFRPLIIASVILGIGFGAQVNSILAHQILQIHHVVGSSIFADGVYQLVALGVCLIGLYLLWRAAIRIDVPHSRRVIFGCMLIGWGAYTAVESLVAHHLLGLHSVVSWLDNPERFLVDLGVLGLGLVTVMVGGLVFSSGRSKVMSDAQMIEHPSFIEDQQLLSTEQSERRAA